jgi:hypothetical protein
MSKIRGDLEIQDHTVIWLKVLWIKARRSKLKYYYLILLKESNLPFLRVKLIPVNKLIKSM